MLRRVHEITGMRIHATDGDIGHLHDVYLAIRVNRFLVPMSAVRWMRWHTRRIPVSPAATPTAPRHPMAPNVLELTLLLLTGWWAGAAAS